MSFFEQMMDLIRVFVLFFGILFDGTLLVGFFNYQLFKRKSVSIKASLILFSVSALAALVCFYGLPKDLLFGAVCVIVGIVWVAVLWGYYYAYTCWSMSETTRKEIKAKFEEKWQAMVLSKDQAVMVIIGLTSMGILTTIVFFWLF